MEEESPSGGKANVEILVRVRPHGHGDSRPGDDTHVDVEHNTISVQSGVGETVHSFSFDHVAGPETDQQSVFESVGKPACEACLAG